MTLIHSHIQGHTYIFLYTNTGVADYFNSILAIWLWVHSPCAPVMDMKHDHRIMNRCLCPMLLPLRIDPHQWRSLQFITTSKPKLKEGDDLDRDSLPECAYFGLGNYDNLPRCTLMVWNWVYVSIIVMGTSA